MLLNVFQSFRLIFTSDLNRLELNFSNIKKKWKITVCVQILHRTYGGISNVLKHYSQTLKSFCINNHFLKIRIYFKMENCNQILILFFLDVIESEHYPNAREPQHRAAQLGTKSKAGNCGGGEESEMIVSKSLISVSHL